MKKILRIIIIVIIAYIILIGSRYGCRFFSASFDKESIIKGNVELVDSLKSHVYKLAHEIGDRSVFEYSKLEEAML